MTLPYIKKTTANELTMAAARELVRAPVVTFEKATHSAYSLIGILLSGKPLTHADLFRCRIGLRTTTTGHLEPREILKTDIGTFELWGGAAKRSNPTRMIR